MDKEIIRQAAELLYIENTDTKDRAAFKDLKETAQKKWLTRATQFFEILEKMNKMIVPLVEVPIQEETRWQRLDKIIQVIKDFNDGVKVFKKELYPTEELANKIVDLK